MQRWSGFALVAFAMVMIGAGLWQVGGPELARAEQRDQRRMDDLLLLTEYHNCLDRRRIDANLTCSDNPPLVDPLGVLYGVDLEKNLVCAGFETDLHQRGAQSRHPLLDAEGCIYFKK